MKITKTASGKTEVKLSRQDWINIGKKAGWNDSLDEPDDFPYGTEGDLESGLDALLNKPTACLECGSTNVEITKGENGNIGTCLDCGSTFKQSFSPEEFRFQ